MSQQASCSLPRKFSGRTALVLSVVTMMSAAIPANRAASIQPTDALQID